MYDYIYLCIYKSYNVNFLHQLFLSEQSDVERFKIYVGKGVFSFRETEPVLYWKLERWRAIGIASVSESFPKGEYSTGIHLRRFIHLFIVYVYLGIFVSYLPRVFLMISFARVFFWQHLCVVLLDFYLSFCI
jgi:hypothetical protein